MLTSAYIRSRLDYDPQTGVFVWKAGSFKGRIAGCDNGNGYWRIGIDNKEYYAHQLAWLYVTGIWPERDIDHHDGNGMNNCFGNLRLATMSQNQANQKKRSDNSSGYKGVQWSSRKGKWVASIIKGGKRYTRSFHDPTEAAAYRNELSIQLFGEFSRAS